MTYNIHSFRIKNYDEYPQDVTKMAHSFLEREYHLVAPVFPTLEEAHNYAKKAALFIMRKWNCDEVTYCVSGKNDETPTLGFGKADYFESAIVTLTLTKEK
jgi:hypothetical protein